MKLADDLPIFRGFGQTQAEARNNVCKLAYDHLCKQGLWLSIRDEIEDPNKEDAINQLEILARRGYFSIPTYEFEQTYDKDGNSIWKSVCHIAEESKSFSAKSSSKKDAKKSAAFKMLQYVLKDWWGAHMTKWCFNYESGEYEYIDKDGYSIDRGEYVYNWDDSEYHREEEEEEERRRNDEEDDW